MPDAPATATRIDCPCGWTDAFARGYSGLQIHCPRCGKRHRIPTFDAPQADDEIDMKAMNKLLQRRADNGDVPGVNFPLLLIAASCIAVLVAALALILMRPISPATIAVAGGALSWPVAMAVAWMGQARYRRRANRQATQAD